MWLSRLRKRRYLRAYFREYGDAPLGRALGMDKVDVCRERERLGLERTAAEEKRCRERGNDSPPAFEGTVRRPLTHYLLSRTDLSIGFVAALVAFILYLWTLGPTITGEDSGELVTAAYTLGIAHPPGYPLWCLLGKLFTYIPYGSIAWRVNLMSAVFGALTIFLLFVITLKTTHNRVAAVCAALVFAFSAEFWEQSVIAEVYTLNAFFVASCLLLLLLWYEDRDKRYLVAFAFTYGLSLSNHNTMHLLGPLFLAFVFYIDQRPWQRWRLYALCLAVSLAPLGIYAYLPIRSIANPPVDWGNPETAQGFWDVFTREQYAFGFTKNPRTLGRFLVQTWAFLKLYAGEFTPWLFWVPLLGVWVLWRRNRFACAALGVFFLYVVFGFIFLLNFDIDKESIWLNNVFWIPAYMIAAIFIGAVIAGLGDLRLNKKLVGSISIAAAGLCILAPLTSNYYKNDKSKYYFSHDFGMNVLNTLAPNAIYFPDADHATFPAIYLQAVDGIRPDVTIGNKYGYPEESLYADMPMETRATFRKIPTEADEAVIETWVVEHSNRPVYFSRKKSLSNLSGKQVVPKGLLYAVEDPSTEQPENNWWEKYTWHTLETRDTRGDLTAEFVLSDYWFGRGRDFLLVGEKEKALEALNQSLAISGDTKEALNNVGSLCAENGHLTEAADYFARTLKLDPKYTFALMNLAKIYMQQAKWDQSQALFDRMLREKLMTEEGMFLSAQCLAEMGRAREALERLQQVANASPKNARVFREMGFLYMNHLGDQQSAQRMWARSLTLDPNQADIAALVAKPHGAESDPTKGLMPELPQIPGLEDQAPQMPQLPTPNLPTPQLPNQAVTESFKEPGNITR